MPRHPDIAIDMNNLSDMHPLIIRTLEASCYKLIQIITLTIIIPITCY